MPGKAKPDVATLAQRTQTVAERTDRLESILASSMERTDSSIERLERAIERMEQEGARDREESARFREDMARDREETKRQAARQRLAREVFDCGERQYLGTRVSLTRSDDRSREREFDALYVGTRAVLLNETRSSPRMSDAQAFARFLESGEFARHAGAQGFVHPALDGEVRDAGELVDVAGDQRRPQRPGMSGDQKVIVADRATDALQFGAYVAVVSVGRLLHREDVLRPHRRIGDLRKLLRYRVELRENLGQRALPLHRLDDKTVVLSVEDDAERQALAPNRPQQLGAAVGRRRLCVCVRGLRRGTLRGLSSAGYDSTSPGTGSCPSCRRSPH